MKKWLMSVVLASGVLSFNAVAEAKQPSSVLENVSVEKQWTVTLNSERIQLDDIAILLVNEAGVKQGVTVEKKGAQMIVTPKEPYAYGEKYYLSASVKNGFADSYKYVEFIAEERPIEDAAVLARIAEIQEKYEQWKPVYQGENYIEKPSITPPYAAGRLHEGVLEDALNTTKLMRYIAYLPTDIQQDASFNEEAQAAALINAIQPNLSHYPSKPAQMEDALFDLAYKGSSTSNLSNGRTSIAQSIVKGYMNDGDASNIDRVGHRVWVLSPKLERVGFGLVADTNKEWNGASAMKVIEDGMSRNKEFDYDYISWPAETAMPTNYFGKVYPWSFSLNPARYDAAYADELDITVTRVTDNRTWRFNNKQEDGYFTVSQDGYGYLPYTIIFRPENNEDNPYKTYKHGDTYRVEIANVRLVNGGTETITFDTTFFTLSE